MAEIKTSEEYVYSKIGTATKSLEQAVANLTESIETYSDQVAQKKAELKTVEFEIEEVKRQEGIRKAEWEREQARAKEDTTRLLNEEMKNQRKGAAEELLKAYGYSTISTENLEHLQAINTDFKAKLALERKEIEERLTKEMESKYSLRKDTTLQETNLKNKELEARVTSLEELLMAAREERDRAFEQLKEERAASVERTKGASPVFNLSEVKK